VMKNKDAV